MARYSIFLLATCVLPTVFVGKPQAQASDPETAARALFLSGKERYKQKSYISALANFHEALRLAPRSSVLLMMAHAYRRVLLPERALRYYKEYLAAWARERPGQDSPHRAVVDKHIADLGRMLERIGRAESRISSEPAVALSLLQAELLPAGGPKVQVGLALCYEKLGQRDQALRWLRAAIDYWHRFRAAWEGERPVPVAPELVAVQGELERLRRLEKRMAAGASKPLPFPAGGSTSAPSPPGRSKFWLVSGITTAALAAGFEVMGWVSYKRGNEVYTNDPAFDRYKRMTIAGHVLAGSMALASGVSFLLYYRSGRRNEERRASFLMLAEPAAIALGARLRF